MQNYRIISKTLRDLRAEIITRHGGEEAAMAKGSDDEKKFLTNLALIESELRNMPAESF